MARLANSKRTYIVKMPYAMEVEQLETEKKEV